MATSFTEEDLNRIEKNILMRESILNDIFNDGPPTSMKDRRLAMELTESIDRTIISKAKIISDDNKESDIKDITGMVGRILLKTSTGILNRESLDPPYLDGSIIVEDPVEGEMDIGISKETYSEFMKRMLTD